MIFHNEKYDVKFDISQCEISHSKEILPFPLTLTFCENMPKRQSHEKGDKNGGVGVKVGHSEMIRFWSDHGIVVMRLDMPIRKVKQNTDNFLSFAFQNRMRDNSGKEQSKNDQNFYQQKSSLDIKLIQ